MENVGPHIRSTRLSRGISLRQLAKRVGISATYLSHIEVQHVPPPSNDKIERIAQELALDPRDLLLMAGRWNQKAAEEIAARPVLRELFDLAFAMKDQDVEDLVATIEEGERPQSRGRAEC